MTQYRQNDYLCVPGCARQNATGVATLGKGRVTR